MITSDHFNESADLTIYDINGKTVLELTNYKMGTKIQVPELENGIYRITLLDADRTQL